MARDSSLAPALASQANRDLGAVKRFLSLRLLPLASAAPMAVLALGAPWAHGTQARTATASQRVKEARLPLSLIPIQGAPLCFPQWQRSRRL